LQKKHKEINDIVVLTKKMENDRRVLNEGIGEKFGVLDNLPRGTFNNTKIDFFF